MKNALAITAAATTIALGSPVLAGTATYTTNGGDMVVTGTPERGGSMQTGTGMVTMDDGSSHSETWTCIGVTTPPNSKIFDVHTVCDVSSPKGAYTATFGCQNMDGGAQGCVGGLYGRTGAYAGKNGATTWAGSGGTGSGTQQWND